MKQKNSELLKKLCGIGVFSAFAYITMLICQLIPNVAGFLSLDAKDAVISVSAFVYGPWAGPVVSLIVALIEGITVSTTGIWGFIMNFVSSAVFSLTASLIYKFFKSFNGAVIGFSAAVIVTTAVMLILNPFIIPMFAPAVTRDAVVSMIPTILLPFNFSKTLMNGAIAMLLYKPIINAMRSAHLISKGYKTEFNKTSVLTLIIGGVSLICAVVILIIIW